MINKNKMSVLKTILILILMVLVGFIFVLDMLPKGIARGFASSNFILSSIALSK